MKKLLITMLALIPFGLMAQSEQNFTIKGKIATVSSPAKAYLQYVVDNKVANDSTTIENGNFEFKGKAGNIPYQAYILLSKKGTGIGYTRDFIQFYVEAGIIEITNEKDSISTATVGGTMTNDDNAAYKLAIKPAMDIAEEKTAALRRASAEEKETPAFKSSIAAIDARLDAKKSAINNTFVKSHSKSFISLNLLSSMAYGLDYAEILPLYESLDQSIKQTPGGIKFGEQLSKMKNVAIGAMVPEFGMADTTGNVVKLSSFKGKYLLIDLWASWCVPCRKENPNLVRTFNKYKQQNFTILGVSLDRPGTKDKWTAAIQKDGLTWTHVSDLQFWNNEVAQLFGVKAIPQNFLLDPQGKVIAKNLIGEELDRKLSEVLSTAKKTK